MNYAGQLVLKTFHSFAALTREIFFNTRREISYLQAAMYYPLFITSETLVAYVHALVLTQPKH